MFSLLVAFAAANADGATIVLFRRRRTQTPTAVRIAGRAWGALGGVQRVPRRTGRRPLGHGVAEEEVPRGAGDGVGEASAGAWGGPPLRLAVGCTAKRLIKRRKDEPEVHMKNAAGPDASRAGKSTSVEMIWRCG